MYVHESFKSNNTYDLRIFLNKQGMLGHAEDVLALPESKIFILFYMYMYKDGDQRFSLLLYPTSSSTLYILYRACRFLYMVSIIFNVNCNSNYIVVILMFFDSR